jgi:hypothetical protein
VNNFIDRSCQCLRLELFCSFSHVLNSSPNSADLGPDRGAVALNPQAAAGHAAAVDAPCSGRLSRACVIEKNLAWSELGQQSCLIYEASPARGLQRKFGASAAEKVQAWPFVGDVERPGLNL